MNPLELSATTVVREVRAKRVSCRELMQAYLERLAQVNPLHNAIVGAVDPDELLRQADAADQQLARATPVVGRLHGLPFAVKDLLPVRGLAHTFGSPIYQHHIASQDAVVVARLRDAGVIFTGKTNTAEFGLGSHTFNEVYGLTRNAINPAWSAGGSSGGAAVALKLNLLPLADGSDYGGSLRNPAGWNGVYGFRTTPGLIPLESPNAWQAHLGVIGPMARSVDDLALLGEVMAGFDARVPSSLPVSMAWRPRAFSAEHRQRLRIGWLGDFNGHVPTDPAVLAYAWKAMERFNSEQISVVPITLEVDFEPLWQATQVIRSHHLSQVLRAHYQNARDRARLKPEALWEVHLTQHLSAWDLHEALLTRSRYTQIVQSLWDKVDFIAAPSAQVFAFDAHERYPTAIDSTPMNTYHEWMKSALLLSMTGCPVLAMPIPHSRQTTHSPMGLQIMAPMHHDARLLHLAKTWESMHA